jgi:phosphatidylglycerophosphate synthase
LLAIPGWVGLVVCALGVQLRLLCNLLDGMVAIEGGKRSVLGQLYNEFPDRVADAVLLVALGYAAGAPWLGWLAALLAAYTAYIRAFGASLGMPQDFRGPMAKPHRMAAMTLGCLLGAIEVALNGTGYALLVAVAVIAAGTLATCVTRTRALAASLQRP